MSARGAARVAKALASLVLPSVEVAVMASPTEVVGANALPVQLPVLGWYTPAPGEQVLVLRYGTAAWVLGGFANLAAPILPYGKVVSVNAAARTAVVTVGASSYTLPLAVNETPAVGSWAAIVWQRTGPARGRGLVVGSYPTQPAEVVLAADQSSGGPTVGDTGADTSVPVADRVALILPTDTATWRAGKWRTDTTDVVQGYTSWGTNHGYAFYGGRLDPYAGKTITRIRLRLHTTTSSSAASNPPRLAFHSSENRGNYEPSAVSPWDGPGMSRGQVSWVDITDKAAQLWESPGIALVANANADYLRCAGVTVDPQSFAIEITYRE